MVVRSHSRYWWVRVGRHRIGATLAMDARTKGELIFANLCFCGFGSNAVVFSGGMGNDRRIKRRSDEFLLLRLRLP
jgi:hypothetical protein